MLESNQKQGTLEGSQYPQDQNGTWVRLPYVWGSVEGRLWPLPRREGTTKIQMENPKSYCLQELESGQNLEWLQELESEGENSQKEPEGGSSTSVHKLYPNFRPILEIPMQSLF